MDRPSEPPPLPIWQGRRSLVDKAEDYRLGREIFRREGYRITARCHTQSPREQPTNLGRLYTRFFLDAQQHNRVQARDNAGRFVKLGGFVPLACNFLDSGSRLNRGSRPAFDRLQALMRSGEVSTLLVVVADRRPLGPMRRILRFVEDRLLAKKGRGSCSASDIEPSGERGWRILPSMRALLGILTPGCRCAT